MRSFVFLIVFFLAGSQLAFAEEQYVFERMWPTLQQPWYFNGIADIAVDKDGNIFVLDGGNRKIHKLNKNGQLITNWSHSGAQITVDQDGFVYVVNHPPSISKFDGDGNLVGGWGSYGSGDGEFKTITGITSSKDGSIFVSEGYSPNDVDGLGLQNYRVQKFSSEGVFITKWGKPGFGNGEFYSTSSITSDEEGNIYVAESSSGEMGSSNPDLVNNRIQKFDSSGNFIRSWDGFYGFGFQMAANQNLEFFYAVDYNEARIISMESGEILTQFGNPFNLAYGNFDGVGGVAVGPNEFLFIATYDSILKFDPFGNIQTQWGSSGAGNGFFNGPKGLGISNSEIFVSDSSNSRIQKFRLDGAYLNQWETRTPQGDLSIPEDLTVDEEGNVIVISHELGSEIVSSYNDNYTLNYSFFYNDSECGWMNQISMDQNGLLYIVRGGDEVFCLEDRILVLEQDGTLVTKIGNRGLGNGELYRPHGIAFDSLGNFYVSENKNHRIQKFDSHGNYVTKWGEDGSGMGQFLWPTSIAVDSQDNIYVCDAGNNRVQKFNSDGNFISQFGQRGFGPGEFANGYFQGPSGIAVTPDGKKVYISDSGNNRIQVFKKKSSNGIQKAIIFNGGGPFSGNPLWNATQMNANFAYRALTYQGFTKNSIYYLTADTDLDLDNNGEPDDVDGDATKANLQHAITQWAADADEVVLYLVDHGGDQSFRMNETEVMTAAELDSWLDQLQSVMPGKVTVVYDACNSGSFLPKLTPPAGKERVIIASATAEEPAYFAAQGSVSFSNYFWTHIFNGLSVGEAFNLAGQFLAEPDSFQTPQVDADGDGKANEPEDLTAIQATYIGNGTEIQGDVPVIGGISSSVHAGEYNYAKLEAYNIRDDDGIARVWAVIRPPGFTSVPVGSSVQNLPILDLEPVGDGRYEGVYEQFTISGTYRIAIYARDRIGNTSTPRLLTWGLSSSSLEDAPPPRRAVLVAGGAQTSAYWPSVEKNIELAYEALRFQGYPDENIYFLSPVTASVGVDGTNVLSNIQYALENWAATSTSDLVLYLVGDGGSGFFDVNPSETLSALDLKAWLDQLQTTITGRIVIVYDAPRAASFIQHLSPPAGKERILIASSGPEQTACFSSGGEISFSHYFWKQVADGASVRDAFRHASNALSASRIPQTPELDDDGDGIGNEVGQDGRLARETAIGSGIMLAGDPPLIGGVSPEQNLNGEAAAALYAENVTTTGTIDQVWATIAPPDFAFDPAAPETRLPVLPLTETAPGRYEGTWGNFAAAGTYEIAFFARDDDGDLSMPVSTSVVQQAAAVIPDEMGDVNGDGFQTLLDAMIALKVLAGDAEAGLQVRWDYEESGADVSGNGRVELEEAVFGLQMAAEVR